ncbi:uncharacterized protein LOC117331634 [Pecten maximus]|uniref:uncharacterized protein LOC117331634 n=1 Tax=Pecten maximus TaxID=6579 RepID=UPI00145893A3|nr:uncharacterized protein LOC117331634 [Pecten maximus]
MGNVQHLLRYLTVISMIWNVEATIDNIDIPPKLVDCFSDWDRKENITTIAGRNVLHTCISDYLWKTGKERWAPDVDPDILKFISADVKEREKQITEKTNSKTTTPSPYKDIRVRKEYRMLTNKERRKYHRAVKALKQDKRLKPNTYDAIANYHNAKIQSTAHGGPNFLGWHRVYLATYEEALRKIDPDVSLPFWDCRLDEDMEDPSLSMLFSGRFAGNGNGEVDNGPFKDWTHSAFGKLTRVVSKGAELMSYEDVENILSKKFTSEITVPTAQSGYNLEYLHGKIHMFVNGHLGDLVSAAHDPLFYMLHAFIDYVWWMFRNKQESNGIDPANDYPETSIKQQQPNLTMDGFNMYKNIDGYSQNWTRDIYTYEMTPTCSKEQPSCNSKWLTCQLDKGRCVSKARRRNNRSKSQRTADSVDSITTEMSQIEEFTSDTCSKLDSTIQNTYSVDGHADSSKWIYLPIKIVNERKQNELFRSFEVVDGIANETLDIYDSEMYGKLKRREDTGKMGTYQRCNLPGSGATKIFVSAYGLNYYGFSTEYTIVDERMPLFKGYTYVPVRKPTEKPSEAFFAAYDSCGRLCKPYCRTTNGTYTRCSATLRIGNYSTGEYGDTYGDAFLNTWNYDDDEIPDVNDDNVHLVFYCNRKEEWPWQKYNK